MIKFYVNENIIKKIKEKVSKNKGEIILSSRRLITGAQKSHYESSNKYNFNYFETGRINGELVDKVVGEGKFNQIKVSAFDIITSGFLNDTYYYSSDLIIPVKKKLTNSSIYSFFPSFSIKDIKKVKQKGEIGFGISEFKDSFSELAEIMGYRESFPYLENLEILVGDEEIKNFVKKSSLNERNLEDFFKLMKKEGEIEERISEHDYEKRENLIEDLTKNISQLFILGKEIKNIEEKVLSAHCSLYKEQDGSYLEWNNRESVDKYHEFESQINPLLYTIKDLLNKSKEVGIENHPSIKGNYIGFPAEIKPKQYLDYVQDNIVLTIEKRLEKLRNHLKKEEKKAYGC